MIYETLPTGEDIPVLGLGTWGIGGGMSPDRSRDRQMVAALETALDLGYAHLDTAEMYGNGHTEELVGQAIQKRSRESLFITSKVSPENLQPDRVVRACEASLRRLDTDYLDLYLIHWPNAAIPLEETFRGLNELVRRGLVRWLGVSNFDLRQLQRAQAASETPLATNQVPYSLNARRYAENGVLGYCQESGIILTAYSPLKSGVLRHPLVRKIAAEHSATPAQVALQWLIHQPRVITIPKSSDRAHLVENLGALDLELTSEEIESLNQPR